MNPFFKTSRLKKALFCALHLTPFFVEGQLPPPISTLNTRQVINYDAKEEHFYLFPKGTDRSKLTLPDQVKI